jgi:predicted metal-dependent hydrolase
MAKSYLLKNSELIKQKANKLNREAHPFNNSSDFQTKWHTLNLLKKPIDHVKYKINNNKVTVTYPENKDINDTFVQEAIREAINETLRFEAKIYLPKRLEELARKNNFRYNKVFIKNIKTQWGSCSYKNNINLNLHIMRLPDHLIDYVLNHELCHTVHKNHSPEFWNLLTLISGEDAKLIQRELRNYSPQIYTL